MMNQVDLTPPRPATTLRKVVIVNGSTDTLELVEGLLDSGRYEIVFVSPDSHPYAQVRQLQPNLVVLCLRIEDIDGFQILSMLKLDEETRQIPVLTYTTEYEGQDVDGGLTDFDEESPGMAKPALRMH
ncbi:MAG: response regulator [Acidobacteria bacterium]|nr:MAG: response regulator [Acidobacteriota bacterium]